MTFLILGALSFLVLAIFLHANLDAQMSRSAGRWPAWQRAISSGKADGAPSQRPNSSASERLIGGGIALENFSGDSKPTAATRAEDGQPTVQPEGLKVIRPRFDFPNTELHGSGASPAKASAHSLRCGVSHAAPEGPGTDGHKPLMRNRVGDDVPLRDRVVAGENFKPANEHKQPFPDGRWTLRKAT